MRVHEIALGVLLLAASGTLLLAPDRAGAGTPLLVAAVASLGLVGWTALLGSASRGSG